MLAAEPLHAAVLANDYAAVRALVAEAYLEIMPLPELVNPIFRRDPDGNLPIHLAAALPFIDARILRMLIDAAPCTACDPNYNGDTPVHMAARTGTRDSVLALAAAEPEGIVTTNRRNALPLQLAAESAANGDVIASLLKCTPLQDAAAAVRYLGQCAGRPLVHIAAVLGSEVLMRRLLAIDASASSETYDGEHPISVAARHNHSRVVDLLVAEAPHTVAALGREGLWHIFGAACDDDASAAPRLRRVLAAAPSLASQPITDDGCLPIHLAAANGMLACARAVLEVEPDAVLAKSQMGHTPLALALRFNHADMAHLLIKAPKQLAGEAFAALHAHARTKPNCPDLPDLYVALAHRYAPLADKHWQLVPEHLRGTLAAMQVVRERRRPPRPCGVGAKHRRGSRGSRGSSLKVCS